MRKGIPTMSVFALVMLLLGLVMMIGGASAACNPGALAVCAPAITSGAKPTGACCSNLRGQQSCFCQYASNPAYGSYVKSPNAKKTASSCGISLPRC